MGIYVENKNGVIVCNLLIICQREFNTNLDAFTHMAAPVLVCRMKTAVGCTITKRITLTEPAGCILFISRKDAKIREERLCLRGDAPLATQIGAKSAKASGTKAAAGGK